jgi:hypothetical protein
MIERRHRVGRDLGGDPFLGLVVVGVRDAEAGQTLVQPYFDVAKGHVPQRRRGCTTPLDVVVSLGQLVQR